MNASNPQGARKAIFWLILMLMPFLFFAVLEMAVRLAGLGHEYPLFIPVVNQPGYLQPNPDVVKRYFSRPELAPKVSPDTLYFHAEKPADSQRIVILGESSAAGFPYGRFGSPSGMLEQRFKFLYPEKNIEVINVAMAAINSYTIRDFTNEVLAIKPDLVLIYAGHNEYLGVMGVGSALAARDSRWKTLTYISLRHSHLFQLLDSAIAGWRMAGAAKEVVSERTLMAKVAANKDISFGSSTYQQGLRQFENNMTDIISAYRKAGVPVVIGTLISNERDQPPFASQDRSNPALQQRLKEVETLRLSGDFSFAENQLNSILNDYPQSADAHFALAQIAQGKNDIPTSLQHYLLAKDYDLLRFRAPEAFNLIINKLTQQPGVYLADVQKELRDRSEQGIIGFNLVLEHLHPNDDGYFWLTDAYVKTILDKKLLSSASATVSLDQIKTLMPVSEIDRIVAEWKVASLTSDYPFSVIPKSFSLGALDTQDKQLAAARYNNQLGWIEAEQQALAFYQRQQDWRNALIILGQMSDALPMNAEISLAAAQLATQLNQPVLALFYSQRGLREKPNKEELLMAKAQALFMSQRFAESKKYLEQVLKQNPQHKMANMLIVQPWAKTIK